MMLLCSAIQVLSKMKDFKGKTVCGNTQFCWSYVAYPETHILMHYNSGEQAPLKNKNSALETKQTSWLWCEIVEHQTIPTLSATMKLQLRQLKLVLLKQTREACIEGRGWGGGVRGATLETRWLTSYQSWAFFDLYVEYVVNSKTLLINILHSVQNVCK